MATLIKSGSNFIFEDANRQQSVFNAQGKIVRTTNAQGLGISYSYNSAGLLRAISDEYSNEIIFSYKNNLIETASIAEYGVFTYGYNAQRLTSVTFSDYQGNAKPVVKTYVYDDPNFDHLLTGVIDETNKRFATWSYDEKGRGVSSEHGDNGAERTTIDYDSRTLTKVTNAFNKEREYAYVDIYGVKQILHIKDQASENCPLSNQHFTYDGNGYLETATDGRDVVTHYERNDRGLITVKKTGMQWVGEIGGDLKDSGVAQEITTGWHDTYNHPRSVKVRGISSDGSWHDYSSVDYLFDTHGRVKEQTVTDLTSHTSPYSTGGRKRISTFTYSYFSGTAKVSKLVINGPRVAADIDGGVDDITTINYNEKGQVTTLVNALDQSVSYEDYSALGRVGKVTDVNNLVTELTYDTQHQLDKVANKTANGNSATDYDFLPNGLLHKVTLADLSSLTFSYNPARHLTAITNHLDELIELTPQLVGGDWKVRTVKTKKGTIWQTSERTYDELGRVMGLLGNDGQKSTLYYDANNKFKGMDEEGHESFGTLETRHIYDELGRLKSSTDGKNEVTGYGYDGQNLLSSVTDANQNTTTYIVDGFGAVIQEDSPDRGVTTYWYDAAGNLEKREDASKVIVAKTYDALNRNVSSKDSKGVNIVFHYDLNDSFHQNSIGRLSSVIESGGGVNNETYYSYTELGQIHKAKHSIQLPNKAPVNATTEYHYELSGKLERVTYPGGRVVNYGRERGQVSSITTQSSEASTERTVLSSFEYAPFGLAERYVYGNGLVLNKSSDLDGRIYSLTLNRSFGRDPKFHLSYKYDSFNNIKAIENNYDPARSKSFKYDPVHGLDWAKGLFGVIGYEYDGVGNRTSRVRNHPSGTKISEEYIYPWPNNRLESVVRKAGGKTKTKTFSYDDNGNISGVSGVGFNRDFNTVREYDSNNQLKASSVSAQTTPIRP